VRPLCASRKSEGAKGYRAFSKYAYIMTYGKSLSTSEQQHSGFDRFKDFFRTIFVSEGDVSGIALRAKNKQNVRLALSISFRLRPRQSSPKFRLCRCTTANRGRSSRRTMSFPASGASARSPLASIPSHKPIWSCRVLCAGSFDGIGLAKSIWAFLIRYLALSRTPSRVAGEAAGRATGCPYSSPLSTGTIPQQFSI